MWTRWILIFNTNFVARNGVMDNHDKQYDRRKVMKVLVIGGVATAVALPGKWTKPLINAVIVPAHAAASAPPTTVPPI